MGGGLMCRGLGGSLGGTGAIVAGLCLVCLHLDGRSFEEDDVGRQRCVFVLIQDLFLESGG